MNKIVTRFLFVLTASLVLLSSALVAQQIPISRVERLKPSNIRARSTARGLSTVEGTKAAEQSYPVAVGLVGNRAYVSDSASNSILVYPAQATAGTAARTFGTSGVGPAQFKDPRGIARGRQR